MKSYDDIMWEHERHTDPVLGDFYLMERKYWVVKCRKCNHQVMGPWPQTDKARQAIITQVQGRECKNCLHEAEKAADG